MPRSIRSFDVFDTLIARRSVEPQRLFQELENRASLPGLGVARLVADQHLGTLGRPYQLDDIWVEVGHRLQLSSEQIERFRELEIRIEHEEVVPIVENLMLVRDGDLLVSDTYLPAQVIQSLLRRAGLERQVALVVSNDGKFRGWIWPQILRLVSVEQHFGDNPHSDGQTPTAAGLKAIIYTGARRTPVEHLLATHGWDALANLIRKVRLANPFADTQPQERRLWLLACQLDFPLLYFASLWLEQHVRTQGIKHIHFISRDCQLWCALYQHLFPDRHTIYLFASRKCLFAPSANYLRGCSKRNPLFSGVAEHWLARTRFQAL